MPCSMDPTLAPVAPCTLAASPDSRAHSAPVLQLQILSPDNRAHSAPGLWLQILSPDNCVHIILVLRLQILSPNSQAHSTPALWLQILSPDSRVNSAQVLRLQILPVFCNKTWLNEKLSLRTVLANQSGLVWFSKQRGENSYFYGLVKAHLLPGLD